MDVWLVHIGEPLPGKGTAMHAAGFAAALAARGHRVLWWVSAFDHFRKQWLFESNEKFSIADGLTGYAIKGCGYSTNTSPRRFVDQRIVARRWRRLAAAEPQPSVVVAAMPPHDLAYEAIRFAADRGIPSLLNLRDPWPDTIVDLAPRILKPLVRLALWHDFKMLRESVSRADSVVSVTQSLMDWATSYSDRSDPARDRVIYTGAKRREPGKPSPEMAKLLASLKGKFVVAFIGTFGFYHLPAIAVKAARRLLDNDIHFVLAGSGDGLDDVRSDASGLPNVHFPGWLSEQDSAELLKCAGIGICPATRHIAILPNKAATYLQAGLPIVSAFDGDLMRLVEQRRIGFNYPVGNVDAFTHAIANLASDSALRKEMSDNALGVYREFFDAEANLQLFASHVEMIAT